jgi:hypothetical protein
MIDKKKFASIASWVLIVGIIGLNIFLLFKLKKNTLDELPLESLKIQKPTMVVIFDEYECATCIENLLFLNDMYTRIKSEGILDFAAIVLSKNKTDVKKISRVFIFPVTVSDDFRILLRLNLHHTPVLLGISPEHRIVYSDLLPMHPPVTEEYIKKGVLDRLYYSIDLKK